MHISSRSSHSIEHSSFKHSSGMSMDRSGFVWSTAESIYRRLTRALVAWSLMRAAGCASNRKNAVIFASYIPDDEALGLGVLYLRTLFAFLADADVFIGINPCAKQQAWCDAIKQSRLHVRYAVVPEHMAIGSDVSAYQIALRLLKESPQKYDLVWFGHTKGSTTRSYDPLRHFLRDFFAQRCAIERIFEDERYGTYGCEAVLYPLIPISDAISQYMQFPCTQLGIMYLYSFYVIRGDIVNRFIHNCSADFFDQKIKGDRYFFERDFYQIAFMQGYEPYAERVVQLHFDNWDAVVSNRETFRARVNQWKQDQPCTK